MEEALPTSQISVAISITDPRYETEAHNLYQFVLTVNDSNDTE